jgi:hypothetical protein
MVEPEPIGYSDFTRVCKIIGELQSKSVEDYPQKYPSVCYVERLSHNIGDFVLELEPKRHNPAVNDLVFDFPDRYDGKRLLMKFPNFDNISLDEHERYTKGVMAFNINYTPPFELDNVIIEQTKQASLSIFPDGTINLNNKEIAKNEV